MIEQLVLNYLRSHSKLPLHYDNNDQSILFADDTIALNVRGWSGFSKLDHGIEIQDAFGEMITQAFNEKYYYNK